MRIGVFAKTFQRPTLEGVLDAVVTHGLDCLQFNMSCAGLAPLPDEIPDGLPRLIRAAMDSRALTMSAVSGTFNMIHPDRMVRADGLRRLSALASVAGALGTSLIALCPGSRDSMDMWGAHRENHAPGAWRDLLGTLERAVAIADASNVTLGIEPEVSTVLPSAAAARRLLDEMSAPRLRIVLDAANLFTPATVGRMHEVLDEAFDLIGGEIALVHAKEVGREGEVGDLELGTGALDFDHYLGRLRGAGYGGTLVMHGLREGQVGASVEYLRDKLRGTSEPGRGPS